MNRTKRTALFLSGSVLIFSSLGTMGCSDDDEKTTEPDPVFPASTPSPTSMQIDLSELSSGNPLLAGPCHLGSAILVGIANFLVVGALAIPVAVLGETLDSDPVYVGDETWRWSGSGGSGGGAWTSQFDGHVLSSDTVEWTMRMSGTIFNLEDFVWYVGQSNVDANTGTWMFYDPADLAELDESMFSSYANLGPGTGLLTFENRNDDGAGTGDILTYTAQGDDLSVSFFNAADNTNLSIEWDQATGQGSRTDAQGGRCCWGDRPDYPDVDPCP